MNSKQRRAAQRRADGKNHPNAQRNRPTGNQEPKPLKQNTPQKRLHITALRRLAGGILAIATICGLYIFWPKISIEPYASIDPHDPFAQLLYVHNESAYPIYQVQPNCGIENVSRPGSRLSGFTIASTKDFASSLGSGEKLSFKCSIAGPNGAKYSKLDLYPSVWFDLPLGFHLCRERHFLGIEASDGSYIWTWQGGGSCPSRNNQPAN
jgi:hypothetical protein